MYEHVVYKLADIVLFESKQMRCFEHTKHLTFINIYSLTMCILISARSWYREHLMSYSGYYGSRRHFIWLSVDGNIGVDCLFNRPLIYTTFGDIQVLMITNQPVVPTYIYLPIISYRGFIHFVATHVFTIIQACLFKNEVCRCISASVTIWYNNKRV